MTAFRKIIALALLLALPGAANAYSPTALSPYAQLQSQDRLLQSVGWQLVRGNAVFCTDTSPAIGLLLQDMRGFSDPDTARKVAGIEGDFAIQAVAAQSPAEAAGLAANDELLAIDGQATSLARFDNEKPWLRQAQLHQMIARFLAADGRVSLTSRSTVKRTAADAVIEGIAVCSSTFEIRPDFDRASADGSRVSVGRDFPGFAYAEDEFAAAVAHELAHNFLAHRVWLDSRGRKRRDIRLTEREADRLTPWLMANAGYQPEAAIRLMHSWGPKHDGGLLRKRTHSAWDERVETIAAELPLIEAARDKQGKADWARHFVRDIAP